MFNEHIGTAESSAVSEEGQDGVDQASAGSEELRDWSEAEEEQTISGAEQPLLSEDDWAALDEAFAEFEEEGVDAVEPPADSEDAGATVDQAAAEAAQQAAAKGTALLQEVLPCCKRFCPAALLRLSAQARLANSNVAETSVYFSSFY